LWFSSLVANKSWDFLRQSMTTSSYITYYFLVLCDCYGEIIWNSTVYLCTNTVPFINHRWRAPWRTFICVMQTLS
jgi:hypothetical protein